jgi:hypothetical protein
MAGLGFKGVKRLLFGRRVVVYQKAIRGRWREENEFFTKVQCAGMLMSQFFLFLIMAILILNAFPGLSLSPVCQSLINNSYPVFSEMFRILFAQV